MWPHRINGMNLKSFHVTSNLGHRGKCDPTTAELRSGRSPRRRCCFPFLFHSLHPKHNPIKVLFKRVLGDLLLFLSGFNGSFIVDVEGNVWGRKLRNTRKRQGQAKIAIITTTPINNRMKAAFGSVKQPQKWYLKLSTPPKIYITIIDNTSIL